MLNREIRNEYKAQEYCADIGCPFLYDSRCAIDNCAYTAKHFHNWLNKKGYSIIRITEEKHRE